MRASPHDEGQLSFYFGGDRLFFRSSMGGQLSAAHAASADSNGHVIGRAIDWNYIPRRALRVHRGYDAMDNEPPPTFVPKHSGGSSGYEIDRGDVMFHARLSRRVTTVAQLDPRAHRILAEVYGDRGARWAALSTDRRNTEGTVFMAGLGPGSIVALYELTADGRALIAHERALTLAHSDPKARAAEAKKTKATAAALAHHRASIEAAIAVQEHEASRLAGLYDLAVEKANAAAAEHKAGTLPKRTSQRHLADAREAVAAPLDALEDTRRTLVLLRRSLAHSGAAPSLPNPAPDPSVKEAFAAVREADLARTEALRDRTRRRIELEAETGAHVPESDPRLPPVPEALTLPVLPVPSLPTLPKQKAEHLTNDELLQNAMLLQRTRPDALRAGRLARAQDAAQKLLQYALGVWLASQPKTPAKVKVERAHPVSQPPVQVAPVVLDETTPEPVPTAERPPPATYYARPIPLGEQRSIRGHVHPGYGRAPAAPPTLATEAP